MRGQGTVRAQLMREDLPYGVRRYANGAKELFNRKYETILSDGEVPDERPDSEEWFYSDKNPPWRSSKTLSKCHSVLRQWPDL